MSKNKMQTVLTKFLIVTFALAVTFTFTIILFQGFCFRGFNIPTNVLLSLVGSTIGEVAGIVFLVYRFCFSNREQRGMKHRREIDRIWAHCLEEKNLIGEIPEKLRNRLEQCMNNYPKENDRRKTHRRKDDIYAYALASI